MTSYFVTQYKQIEEIERYHQRLHAFLGNTWAEQMIIALHNIARTGKRSYLSLLVETTNYVVQHSTH